MSLVNGRPLQLGNRLPGFFPVGSRFSFLFWWLNVKCYLWLMWYLNVPPNWKDESLPNIWIPLDHPRKVSSKLVWITKILNHIYFCFEFFLSRYGKSGVNYFYIFPVTSSHIFPRSKLVSAISCSSSLLPGQTHKLHPSFCGSCRHPGVLPSSSKYEFFLFFCLGKIIYSCGSFFYFQLNNTLFFFLLFLCDAIYLLNITLHFFMLN